MNAEKNWISLTTSEEDEGSRLDIFLSRRAQELSRSRAQALIDEAFVLVDGKPAKANLRLKCGQEVKYSLPPLKSLALTPEEIPLHLYHEDEDLAVLEKPAGLVVHPGAGHGEGTLVHGLLHRFGEKLGKAGGIGGELRPGIVHRIDKNTSGILVVTKSDRAHQALSAQFKEHSIGRRYTAIVWGKIPKEGDWTEALGRDPSDRQRIGVRKDGRKAHTRFRKLADLAGPASLVEAELFTGRTHQIRVHFSVHGFPLVGDSVYGSSPRSARGARLKGMQYLHKNAKNLALSLDRLYEGGRQFLHASYLSFAHPVSGERLVFESPLPEDLQSLLREWEAVSK